MTRYNPFIIGIVGSILGLALGVGNLAGAGSSDNGFWPLAPERLLDTRDVMILGAGETVDVHVGPVRAAALNITVTEPEAAGYVTVWPTGQPMPDTSTVNYVTGQTIANSTLVGVGTGGQVSIYTMVPTHVVVDMTGTFGYTESPVVVPPIVLPAPPPPTPGEPTPPTTTTVPTPNPNLVGCEMTYQNRSNVDQRVTASYGPTMYPVFVLQTLTPGQSLIATLPVDEQVSLYVDGLLFADLSC